MNALEATGLYTFSGEFDGTFYLNYKKSGELILISWAPPLSFSGSVGRGGA